MSSTMDPEHRENLDGILFKTAMDLNGEAGSPRLQTCYIHLKENEKKVKAHCLDPPSEEPLNVIDLELDIQDPKPNMHSHAMDLEEELEVA